MTDREPSPPQVLLLSTDEAWARALTEALGEVGAGELHIGCAATPSEALREPGGITIDVAVFGADIGDDAHIAELLTRFKGAATLALSDKPGVAAQPRQSDGLCQYLPANINVRALAGYIFCAARQARGRRDQIEAHERLARLVAERAEAAQDTARAEAAQEYSERRFRDLVETTSDWIWEVDALGVYTYASPKVAELLGYAPREIMGKTPFDFMPPEEAERVAALFRKIVEARSSFSDLVNVNVHRDGSNVVLETSGIPVIGDDGTLLGYRGIDRDISERKRHEEELQAHREHLEELVASRTTALTETNLKLKESERRLDTVLTHVPACIAYVDKEHRYRYNNRLYLEWFGLTPDELYGQHVRDVLGETTYAKVRPYVERALAGEVLSYERRVVHPNGRERWISAVYLPDRNPKGGIDGYYAVVMDVTDRKQAEARERQQMSELAHAYRLATVGELATELAHELNQPLTTINNYSEACLRMLASDQVERTDIYEILERVSQQAHWAASIVRRLREFVGPHEPRFAAHDPETLVRDVLHLIETDARYQETHVDLAFAASLPQVRADAILVQQVVLNLTRNALEAMQSRPPPARRLTLAARLTDDGMVEISIQDTGPGIEPDTLEHLFDAFHTTKTGGMGLGLSISRSIIEAHGGHLRMTHTSPEGTTFTFTLPTERRPEAPAP